MHSSRMVTVVVSLAATAAACVLLPSMASAQVIDAASVSRSWQLPANAFHARELAANAETVLIGGPRSGITDGKGLVTVWHWDDEQADPGLPWDEESFPSPDGELDENCRYGGSLAIRDDDQAMFHGAPLNGPDDRGTVFEFRRDGDGNWTRHATYEGDPGVELGADIAVSDRYLAIGATGFGLQANGQAIIYELDEAGEYQEVSRFVPTGINTAGSDLAFDGDTLYVGATNYSGTVQWAGTVYVLDRQSDGSWEQVDQLRHPDAIRADLYGASIVAENGLVAVASPYSSEREGGVVDVWARADDGSYELEHTFERDEPYSGVTSQLQSVVGLALSGQTLAMGWSYDLDRQGEVQVMARQGGQWYELATIDALWEGSGVYSGYSLAFARDWVITQSEAANAGAGYARGYQLDMPPDGIDLDNQVLEATSPAGTPVGTLRARDENRGDTFTYTIEFTPEGMFSIADDLLVADAVVEGTHQVVIEAADRAGWTVRTLFEIEVTSGPSEDVGVDVAEPGMETDDASTGAPDMSTSLVDASTSDLAEPVSMPSDDGESGCCTAVNRRSDRVPVGFAAVLAAGLLLLARRRRRG